jgi:ADP-ribosylglycohydrolase
MPPSTNSRRLGALLGVHAGDSLGATCEFMPWKVIATRYPSGVREICGGGPFGWPAGHATDDTDLTRAVALAYRDVYRHLKVNPGDYESINVTKRAGEYMLNWYNGDWPGRQLGSPPRDVGNATAMGLMKFEQNGKDPNKAGAGIGSAGNGSLMRCIPTAVFQNHGQARIDESIWISKVTHDDPRCTISCAAYNEMAMSLISGESVAEAISRGETLAQQLESKQNPAAASHVVTLAIQRGRELEIIKMANEGPKGLTNGGAGFVLESLIIAVAAIRDERSLEDVLVDVVRIGKDTDTNAAIAGGLLGARDGSESIPERWREKLQFATEFEEIFNECCGVGVKPEI